MSSSYISIIGSIIKSQKVVLGSIAIDMANKVKGLKVASDTDIVITGDPKSIVSDLVHEYETLFGRASIETCKDAVLALKDIDKGDLPDILKRDII